MSVRLNDKLASYAPINEDAAAAPVSVGNATVSRLDLGAGYWTCWAPTGVAANTFRLRRLVASHTAVAGDLTVPASVDHAQAPVAGLALVPADSTFTILVPDPTKFYWAIMWDGAAPIDLNCTRIL